MKTIKVKGLYNKVLKLVKMTPKSGQIYFEFWDLESGKYFHYQLTPANVDSGKSKAEKYLRSIVRAINSQKNKKYDISDILPDCLSLRTEHFDISDGSTQTEDLTMEKTAMDFTSSTIAQDAEGIVIGAHVVEREMENEKIYKDVDQILTADKETIEWFNKRWRETEWERLCRISDALKEEQKRKERLHRKSQKSSRYVVYTEKRKWKGLNTFGGR